MLELANELLILLQEYLASARPFDDPSHIIVWVTHNWHHRGFIEPDTLVFPLVSSIFSPLLWIVLANRRVFNKQEHSSSSRPPPQLTMLVVLLNVLLIGI